MHQNYHEVLPSLPLYLFVSICFFDFFIRRGHSKTMFAVEGGGWIVEKQTKRNRGKGSDVAVKPISMFNL